MMKKASDILGIAVVAIIVGALTVSAQWAPSQAPPNGNIAPPVNTGNTAQIRQGQFGLDSTGTLTTIPATNLMHINAGSSINNAIYVKAGGAGKNALRTENGNVLVKTGSVFIDSDVPTQNTSWTANSGYALDMDGPISTNGLYSYNNATINGTLYLNSLIGGSGAPVPVCVDPTNGKILKC